MVPQSGKFIISSDQSYAIFVRSILPEKGRIALYGVLVVASPKISYREENPPAVMLAERGYYEDGKWILEKPTLVNTDIRGQRRLESAPDRLEFYTAVDPQAFKPDFLLQFPMWQMGERAADDTFEALAERIQRNKQAGIDDKYTLLDYHFKLSVPFSCLVMALCCPPLALRFAKGGGFTGTLLSICLVFVYWNTMLLMRILGSPGPEGAAPLLPPQIAAWTQNILFTLIGLYALRKSE
jgi:lipopolysaccharide export LptBFGC system permease protein LptF